MSQRPWFRGYKNLPAMPEMQVQSLGWEDTLEESMATYSMLPPKEAHGQRSLGGYSPEGLKASGMTEMTEYTQRP